MDNKLAQNKTELHELQVMYNSGENQTPEVLKRIKLLTRIIELQEVDSFESFSDTLTKPFLKK